jgi:putative alpha-1,2-mannosidase
MTGPTFEKVRIKIGNGKTLVISAPRISDRNCYIKSVRINGKLINNYKFAHADLVNGGLIEYEMTDHLENMPQKNK